MTTSSTTSAVDEFEQVVVSEDIIYTKQVISEQLVCRREDSNPREFFLARFKYLYNAILQLIIKRKLFHWKNFAVTNYSAKTTKLFHLEQFAIYGIAWAITSYQACTICCTCL